MNTGAVLFGLLGLAAFAATALEPSTPGRFVEPQDHTGYSVLLSGQFEGNLSPCGCTKPMSGGLRRLVSAVTAQKQAHVLHLQMGPWIAGVGRQDVLKAETFAQAVRLSELDAVGASINEARLGAGELDQLKRLSGNKLLSPLQPSVEAGSFSIGWATTSPEIWSQSLGETVDSAEEATQKFTAGTESGQKQILLLDGSEEQARGLAKRFPTLSAIVFRSQSRPAKETLSEGKTWLLSPGEHGKFLVRVDLDTDKAASMITELGPAWKDDSRASELYRRYLTRVSRENLLEKLPRSAGPAYVGSARCGSCHQASLAVWRKSAHAHALPTLAKTGNDRDPECLPCHVVGLESQQGFKSPALTPQLAAVGCESCHGSGAKHSANPKRYGIDKSGAKSCAKCHTLSTSPEFNFLTYWQKIRHR